MPRLRNVETGSVVNVDDETAKDLGSVYVPAADDDKKPPAKKAASSKTEK